MMHISEFSCHIQKLALDLPTAWARHLSNALVAEPPGDWERLRLCMLQGIRQTQFIERIEAFCDTWQYQFPEFAPQSVALSLLATAEAVEKEQDRENISLVWTGPESDLIPLRRTEQVLLQLIRGAEKNLLLVSFAVYKAKAVMAALEQATGRGVQIQIVLESPEASAWKVGFDPIENFSTELREAAQFYIWPLDERPRSEDGKHGSLHAKFAVADGQSLFITSANLTDYAMNLNNLSCYLKNWKESAKTKRTIFSSKPCAVTA